MATHFGYSPISSRSRVQILAILIETPDRTIEDLRGATGLHPNTVREHLQRLIASGFVVESTEHRTTRGRPRSLFRAVTAEDATANPIIRRLAREAAERGDMMRRVMPETIAEGLTDEEQHQLDAIVEHLQDSGFDPLVDETDLTVDLSPCSHLAEPEAATRCRVHITLINSVLAQAGGPLTVDAMHKTCNPRDCVLQLLRRTPDTASEHAE